MATFRICFGALVAIGILRFWLKGWIEELYLQPNFHFSYYGFEWVKPFGDATYLLFIVCFLAAIGVMLGWRYRFSSVLLFLSFTYIELMDKTTYLNHYYFVSVVSFILLFLPAAANYSLDARRAPHLASDQIPRFAVVSLQLLLALVYFYAGLAKLNSDWLFAAQPLRTWLATKTHIPLVGPYLGEEWVAYAFSWGGAAYDLFIPFLLWWSRTRFFAFTAVIAFHVMTRVLFPIGMFPYFMITATLIFCSSAWHERILAPFRIVPFGNNLAKLTWQRTVLIVILALQLLLPWRYLTFPGELFWTEQGFRYSWRVMLMEKAGYAQFKVVDSETKRRFYVDNTKFLTPFQEKQMAFQPDFIVEYAHYLADHYRQEGVADPQIYTDCYVALNGRPSQQYIDPQQDLTQLSANPYASRHWLLPFGDDIKGL